MKRIALLVAPAIMLATACSDMDLTDSAAGVDPAFANGFGPAGSATYHVTIWNLTSGQPLTPPLIAAHKRPVGLFAVGSAATFELKEIAENGNLDPMVTFLSATDHVAAFAVLAGDPPPLLAGQSIQGTISTERGAKYFSFVSMLICTNDGFTGVDAWKLPAKVGESVTLESNGYDAGTEINTEDFADLVPPCPVLTGVASSDPGTGMSNPALVEGGVIRHHPGIQGIADLDPAIHGWTDPVARVRIERVN